MENKLTLTTGDIRYQLVNEYGENIGVLQFNPVDIDILNRFDKVQEHFMTLKYPSNLTLEQIFDLTDDIKEQFDYLLNRKVSEQLFDKCNPLSPLPDGSFFFVSVLEKIAQIIKEQADERTEIFNKKIEKAIADIPTIE